MAKLIIDKDNIRHNYRYFKELTGNVAPVIKANAYGVGSKEIYKLLKEEGAKEFFFAHLEEALELKNYLSNEDDFYVFHGFKGDYKNIYPVINSNEQLSYFNKNYPEKKCVVHIETGMNRLGFQTSNIPINTQYIISHLSCAGTDPNYSRQQLNNLKKYINRFPNAKFSIANSFGCFLGKEFHLDMVRVGIGLYGSHPDFIKKEVLKYPVRLNAKILQIKEIKKGEAVGYDRRFIADDDTRIANIAIGYADGIHRNIKGYCKYKEKKLPILGNVSMDILAIKIDDLCLREGDEITIFDNIDEFASYMNSISYEVLTSIGNRVVRSYK